MVVPLYKSALYLVRDTLDISFAGIWVFVDTNSQTTYFQYVLQGNFRKCLNAHEIMLFHEPWFLCGPEILAPQTCNFWVVEY